MSVLLNMFLLVFMFKLGYYRENCILSGSVSTLEALIVKGLYVVYIFQILDYYSFIIIYAL